MAAGKKRICPYSECRLPKNNQRFLWQFLYVFVGLAILLLDEESFTFFQVFLFVAPCLLDIAYNDIGSFILDVVRIIFGVLNAALLVFCILGMVEVIKDTGSTFVVNLEVIAFAAELPKKTLAFAMAPNLIVPLVYYATAPSQHMSLAMKLIQKVRGKAE